jgi:predicted alpha/beta-fold hydrolase
MPILSNSKYRPLLLLSNKHINTIIPSLFRKVDIEYQRERITTTDNDFIDLDFSSKGNDKVVLVLHGLEGSSKSSNVKGIVKISNLNNYDAVVLNFRGCSGEPNKLLSAYHSGKTDDIDLTIKHLSSKYKSITTIGFSLGGNAMLKYLGEQHASVALISKSVAISVPCNLKSSANKMAKSSNSIYMKRFLKTLKSKVFEKCKIHTDHTIDLIKIEKSKNFSDFDDEYTAPIHGFGNADNYWKLNSSKQFLKNITTPTLLINALDDPFLTEDCFPNEIAKTSDSLFLETPKKGGHMGFLSKTGINGIYWHEQRAFDFLTEK